MHSLVRRFNVYRPDYTFGPEWNDLDFLFDEVLRLKPRFILELGSGCSTIALWKALHQVAENGKLVSLEGDPYWYGVNYHALQRMGLIEVPRSPTLVFSPVVHDPVGQLRYQTNPLRGAPIDFIYVDGPRLYHTNDVVIDTALFTPLAEEIVVDGRRSQGQLMAQHLKKWYGVEWDEGEKRWVFRKRHDNG